MSKNAIFLTSFVKFIVFFPIYISLDKVFPNFFPNICNYNKKIVKILEKIQRFIKIFEFC